MADIDHEDLIYALHDKLGYCGHCGESECIEKGRFSKLPPTLDMAVVMDTINELAEEDS